ncbi:MAG: hypothetical protein ACOCUT_03410 [bacterium]
MDENKKYQVANEFLANYNFGSSYIVLESDGWEYEPEDDNNYSLSSIVYISPTKEEQENSETFRVSFRVRFLDDKVVDVYALDMDNGNDFGFIETKGLEEELHPMYFLKIKNVEIQDLEIKDESGYKISGVQAGVEILLKDEEFLLLYQTSDTLDSGAVGLSLDLDMAVDENARFRDFCEENDISFDKAKDFIVDVSQAQKKWTSYIEENYEIENSSFNGFDANSCNNVMQKKEITLKP